MTSTEVEVHGTPPLLTQKICREILFEQYWHSGTLVNPVNVCYFLFEDIWHRLHFDHGIIFWRQQTESPRPYSMPELNAEARIDTVGERFGLAGQRLLSYIAHSISGGSEVAFLFEDGPTLIVRNISDRTSCLIKAGHAA